MELRKFSLRDYNIAAAWSDNAANELAGCTIVRNSEKPHRAGTQTAFGFEQMIDYCLRALKLNKRLSGLGPVFQNALSVFGEKPSCRLGIVGAVEPAPGAPQKRINLGVERGDISKRWDLQYDGPSSSSSMTQHEGWPNI